jgi:hypothetical protein
MTALPALDRFMKTPEFVRLYYKLLKDLAETTFSPAQMDPFLEQLLSDHVPAVTINTMKAFNAAQASNVLARIPLELTAVSALPLQNGYYYTTIPSAALHPTTPISPGSFSASTKMAAPPPIIPSSRPEPPLPVHRLRESRLGEADGPPKDAAWAAGISGVRGQTVCPRWPTSSEFKTIFSAVAE